MKVLILVILFTLCSAQEDFLNKILKELKDLSNATNLTTVNDTQLHSISGHTCKCEEAFVQNLNTSIKLIRSTTHQDHLYNIIEMLDSHPSPNTEESTNTCEKETFRKRRFSTVYTVKVYINASITFIKKWNKSNCIKNSAYRHNAHRKQ
ncbi:hypothetical protein IRJ41_011427 [Triplophysa rosa]|uniref:Interleukin-7 n=1 Tax=Triplophysa rosa TaxID=992332 RepID=A0A9W7TR59_TRIRA|nr:hypothetical protein IRJ41_011427 [Triplophysa rosa]